MSCAPASASHASPPEASPTYDQLSKSYVRQELLTHAVHALTSERAANAAVPRTYMRQCWKALLEDGEVSNYFRAVPNLASQVEAQIDSWEVMHDSVVGKREASGLRVAYLAGANPLNDFRVLVSLGVLPVNIWAFELNDLPDVWAAAGGKVSYLRDALFNVAASEFPLLKVIKGSLTDFMRDHPGTFDIIYCDHTLQLPSVKGETLQFLSALLTHRRLASPGMLVTNFSFDPLCHPDGRANPKARDQHDAYAKVIAACLYPRECAFAERDTFSEQDRDSGFDSYEANGLDLSEFEQQVRGDVEFYYSQFVTRLMVDMAGTYVPWGRLAHSPLLSSQFLHKLASKPWNPKSRGIPAPVAASEPVVVSERRAALCTELQGDECSESTMVHGRIAQHLQDVAKKPAPPAEPVEDGRHVIYVGEVAPPLSDAAQKQAALLAAMLAKHSFGDHAPGVQQLHTLAEMRPSLALLDILLNWEHAHLSTGGLDSRLLLNVLRFVTWPSLGDAGRSSFPQLCDVPTPNLPLSGVFGLLAHPSHVVPSASRRWRYVAKHRPMFVDALLLDECRYVYDLFPTPDQMAAALLIPAQQIMCRTRSAGALCCPRASGRSVACATPTSSRCASMSTRTWRWRPPPVSCSPCEDMRPHVRRRAACASCCTLWSVCVSHSLLQCRLLSETRRDWIRPLERSSSPRRALLPSRSTCAGPPS